MNTEKMLRHLHLLMKKGLVHLLMNHVAVYWKHSRGNGECLLSFAPAKTSLLHLVCLENKQAHNAVNRS